MPITRLNHAVLYVRDVAASADFYQRALGFRVKIQLPGAAFLQAEASQNDHDLGLFQVGSAAVPSAAGQGAVGLYHLAWEVDTLAELERVRRTLTELGSLVGATDHGTTKALYARDPDGLEFEVCWLVPAALLTDDVQTGVGHLDLAAEQQRYGATTRGGIGVSSPG
jgi:catechol-2,3-dioxygenase